MRYAVVLIAALGVIGASPAVVAGQGEETVEVRESSARGSLGLGWAYGNDYVIRQGESGTRPRQHPTVSRVSEGGAAERAGLRAGDVILTVNGVDSRQGPLFRDRTPGTRYTVRVRRGDQEREVVLVVAERRDQ